MKLLGILNTLINENPEISEQSAKLNGNILEALHLFGGMVGNNHQNILTIYPEILLKIKDRLLEAEEFKNVKTINIVSGSIYMASQNDEPIINDKTYLGGPTKLIGTNTYRLDSYSNEPTEFNEIIDIHSIRIGPKPFDMSKLKDLGPGVWILPDSFNAEYGVNKRVYVEVSLDQLAANTKIKDNNQIMDRMLEAFKDALYKNTVNVPVENYIDIALSPRSIKTGFIINPKTTITIDGVERILTNNKIE